MIDSIPIGTLENVMKKFKTVHENSYFTCIKIGDQTDKMFGIMKENFEGLMIVDMKEPTAFMQTIENSIQHSIKERETKK